MADDDVRRAAALEHHPVGTVLVHPDDSANDPEARRILCRAVTPGEWPWIRVTGAPAGIAKHGGSLAGWQLQALGDLALVLGHRLVLTGHEVSR